MKIKKPRFLRCHDQHVRRDHVRDASQRDFRCFVVSDAVGEVEDDAPRWP